MRPRDVPFPGYEKTSARYNTRVSLLQANKQALGIIPVSVCYRRTNRQFRNHL
jgi:hypothetical protein